MANRKQLKKSIKLVTGELFADCVALSMCQQGDEQKLHALMEEVASLHIDFVSRISHTEPGNVKGFYRNLKAEFTQKANELSEKIVQA